jgi:hypothetical protein
MLRVLSRIGYAVTVCVGVCGEAALPASAPLQSAYAAVSEVDTADDSVTSREMLVMEVVSGRPVVTISNGRGSSSFITEVSADGQIAAPRPDGGIVCYNMAEAVMSAYAADAKKPLLLDVAFLGRVVPVQLSLQATNASDGAAAVVGEGRSAGLISDGTNSMPGGIIVNAKVTEQNGVLRDAYFSETSLIGSPARALDRNVCSLAKLTPQPITPATPAQAPVGT